MRGVVEIVGWVLLIVVVYLLLRYYVGAQALIGSVSDATTGTIKQLQGSGGYASGG